MMTTTTSHIALLSEWNRNEPQVGGSDEPSQRRDSWIPAAIALGVALTALVALLASRDSTASRLRALPAAERVAVVERAVGNLRDVCRGNDRPREFCKAQAALAFSMPECTEACQSLAREELRADSAVK